MKGGHDLLNSRESASCVLARPLCFVSLFDSLTGLWLVWNEGMENRMETIIMGYIGITIRVHSFIPD